MVVGRANSGDGDINVDSEEDLDTSDISVKSNYSIEFHEDFEYGIRYLSSADNGNLWIV